MKLGSTLCSHRNHIWLHFANPYFGIFLNIFIYFISWENQRADDNVRRAPAWCIEASEVGTYINRVDIPNVTWILTGITLVTTASQV